MSAPGGVPRGFAVSARTIAENPPTSYMALFCGRPGARYWDANHRAIPHVQMPTVLTPHAFENLTPPRWPCAHHAPSIPIFSAPPRVFPHL